MFYLKIIFLFNIFSLIYYLYLFSKRVKVNRLYFILYYMSSEDESVSKDNNDFQIILKENKELKEKIKK